MATLVSAGCLVYLGALFDRTDLRLYSICVCVGMAASALTMAISWSAPVLGLAIFGLRLSGQGLMSHISAATMARHFAAARGKALSIAALGNPIGEGIFPISAVLLSAAIGWRYTWAWIAALIVAVVLPLVFMLLAGHSRRREESLDGSREAGSLTGAGDSWSRSEVLKDPQFQLRMPAILAPSFIITGLFFHQVSLVEAKGWTLAWFAGAFVAYAVTITLSSLAFGPVVDRFRAVRLLPYYLLPLAASLAILAEFDHPLTAFAFMVISGISVGAGYCVNGAIWAEIYGVAHIGAIRSMTASLGVFASALAPVLFGLLLDFGMSIEVLCLICTAYVIAGIGLILLAGRFTPRRVAS